MLLTRYVYFNAKLERYVRSEWGYKCFFASYSLNSRGVAIMFMNKFEFRVNDVRRDENVIVIIIYLSTMGTNLLLVNIYIYMVLIQIPLRSIKI